MSGVFAVNAMQWIHFAKLFLPIVEKCSECEDDSAVEKFVEKSDANQKPTPEAVSLEGAARDVTLHPRVVRKRHDDAI